MMAASKIAAGRPGAYSPAEARVVWDMRHAGASAIAIGAALGRSPASVKYMVSRIQIPLHGIPRKSPGYVPIDRECLSCGRHYRAETKFLRLCKPCRVAS